jgi:Flp pilus assembly pilin Flp
MVRGRQDKAGNATSERAKNRFLAQVEETTLQTINNFLMDLYLRAHAAKSEAHEEGQTLVEYALIIALMSIALVGALGLLRGGVGDVFDDIVNELSGAGGS